MKTIRAKFMDASACNSRIKSPDMEKKRKMDWLSVRTSRCVAIECCYGIISERILHRRVEIDNGVGRNVSYGIPDFIKDY